MTKAENLRRLIGELFARFDQAAEGKTKGQAGGRAVTRTTFNQQCK